MSKADTIYRVYDVDHDTGTPPPKGKLATKGNFPWQHCVQDQFYGERRSLISLPARSLVRQESLDKKLKRLGPHLIPDDYFDSAEFDFLEDAQRYVVKWLGVYTPTRWLSANEEYTYAWEHCLANPGPNFYTGKCYSIVIREEQRED